MGGTDKNTENSLEEGVLGGPVSSTKKKKKKKKKKKRGACKIPLY